VPREPAGHRHAYQSYVLMVTEDAAASRDAIASRLAADGIATRQGTHAVHALGYYAARYGLVPADCPQAFAADRRSLALPLYPQMTADEQQYVIDRVIVAVRRH
jgi:dTDP-4-amino-4,6-dideoxygalactose transaminase